MTKINTNHASCLQADQEVGEMSISYAKKVLADTDGCVSSGKVGA